MGYWWVNQNQTYQREVKEGFLWSPKTRADGAKHKFYDNMREVLPGDIVFSFCDTRIKAVGVAQNIARSAPKPDFGTAGDAWLNDGWFVPVQFIELQTKIRPKDHIDLIRPHLPNKYAPLRQNGDGLQSVYLAEVPEPMAAVLGKLIGPEYSTAFDSLQIENLIDTVKDEKEEQILNQRTDIGPTTIVQLINARRGQGKFKENVCLIENGCRVTGVKERHHLRASHIKPWRNSNDQEKLDGFNGLLLAPHVDHLFDKGFISFSDDGQLLVSMKLESEVLTRWGLSEPMNVGPFNQSQSAFLSYHRETVFKL